MAWCEIFRWAGASGTFRHLSLDLGHLPIGYAGVDALLQLINHHRQVAVEAYPVDWHCKDDDGLTPLMHAVQKNALDCVRFLATSFGYFGNW